MADNTKQANELYLLHAFNKTRDQAWKRHDIRSKGDDQHELKKYRQERRPWVIALLWFMIDDDLKLFLLKEKRIVFLFNHMMYVDGAFKFTAGQIFSSINTGDAVKCTEICHERAESLFRFYTTSARDTVPSVTPGKNFIIRSYVRRNGMIKAIAQMLANTNVEKTITILENNQSKELFECIDRLLFSESNPDLSFIREQFHDVKLQIQSDIKRRYDSTVSCFTKDVSAMNVDDEYVQILEKMKTESDIETESGSDEMEEEEEEEKENPRKKINSKEASSIFERISFMKRDQ